MINNTYFVAMQNFSLLPKKKLTLIVSIILFSVAISKGQAVYLPYSYDFDQKFNSSIYSLNTTFHTSLKPFLIDTVIAPRYKSLMQVGADSSRKTWVARKLFDEHLFDVKTKEYTFYADFLTDIGVGRDIAGKKNTNINTRGFQLGGTIGKNFFFYTSAYENSADFPAYYASYVNSIGFVPGQGYKRTYNGQTAGSTDWDYVTATISYIPVKQLNVTIGEDKVFIGDGYRSLLLSDYAASYPLARLTVNLGPVQYMVMWAYLEDLTTSLRFDTFGSARRKVAGFHYVDWNVTNRFSVGFFNAVIAEEANTQGQNHGFDANFINPIIFAKSVGPSAQPDNVFAGFTAKYKILDKTAVYGQVLLDKVSGGTSTIGMQFGIRGADLLNVTNFNYLFEFNTVKPYTYTSGQVLTNYTEYSQPLGDPLGANFREFIGILNYSSGRFDFTAEAQYARYGLDPQGLDYGKDLTKTFPATPAGSSVGQGIATNLYYGEGKISYLINPKSNLRFELAGLVRDEKNNLGSKKTTLVSFGLRSSIRGLYHDF